MTFCKRRLQIQRRQEPESFTDMAREKTWRDIAKPIIREVLSETKGLSEREIKAAIRDAYPFGERNYHPYKIWLDEVRRQRGIKRTKTQASNDNHPKLF